MRRRTTRIARAGAIAAAALGASLWMLPAWGSVSVPPPGAGRTSTAATSGAMAGTSAMDASALASGDQLTQQVATARQATAKYATNLSRAKADGYKIITMMMPNMGYHFMNAAISGFNIRKPQILVYEHTGQRVAAGGPGVGLHHDAEDAAAAERDVRLIPGGLPLR